MRKLAVCIMILTLSVALFVTYRAGVDSRKVKLERNVVYTSSQDIIIVENYGQ